MLIDMNTEILKELGLTSTEIKVYIGLLRLGPSLASKIGEKADVERAVTYHVLAKLIKKGVVGYVIKENRKYFSATDPEKLLDLLKEKEESIKDIIPQLKALKEPQMEEPIVEVYKGKEGLKTALNDVLDEGKDYFIIGYTAAATRLVKHWFAHWHRRRIKLKIKRNILFPDYMKNEDVTRYSLTRGKFLPKGYATSASTIIYGKDKVLVFLPTKEDFTGIIIKSKEVWESYKSTFDVLWGSTK